MNYPVLQPSALASTGGRRVAAGAEGEDLSPSLGCHAHGLHRSLTPDSWNA